LISIVVIGYAAAARRWEHALVARLRAAGHAVEIRLSPKIPPAAPTLDLLLKLEGRRFGPSLAASSGPLDAAAGSGGAMVIDLTGEGSAEGVPVLTLEFSGEAILSSGINRLLASGGPAQIVARLDGVAVAQARPMIGDRVWLGRGSNDLLAGAISLVEQCIARFSTGRLLPIDETPKPPRGCVPGLLQSYLPALALGLVRRAIRKVTLGQRPFYWQVGYRLNDGPGVADTGRLDGPPFQTLPDDGSRFYADPFAFEHHGRQFVFVEEFPYATGRGVISVAELGSDGRLETPRVVLDEPHHLSYPQVFEHDGEIYMIPESSAARELVLYRAAAFPECWVRDTVLLAGEEYNDATLLQKDGRFWLFGTQRRGVGSSSDTMAVYSAPSLHGPWTPHALNPILIDQAAARPGGLFVEQNGKVLLPVQDGSLMYGGGLGLMELKRLDDEDVVFSRPAAVADGNAWGRGGIHTLNRAGRLEVIDSAG
jgi:hypothetical protein